MSSYGRVWSHLEDACLHRLPSLRIPRISPFAGGGIDPECPQYNRPIAPAPSGNCQSFPANIPGPGGSIINIPAFAPQIPGSYCTAFVMDPPGTPPKDSATCPGP